MNRMKRRVSFMLMILVLMMGVTNTYADKTNGAKYGIDVNTVYEAGQYKVGRDITAGEYVILTTGSTAGYFCLSSDPNKEDIIQNDNFDTNSIITIKNGEYIQIKRAVAIPSDEFYDRYTINYDKNTGVMLTVGKDIAPGEYKLKNVSSSMGYYCIYNSSRQDKIESNDNFENTTYVRVTRGQYLVLNRCKIVK